MMNLATAEDISKNSKKGGTFGPYLTSEILTLVVGQITQQAVEKIDKIRGLAGEALQHLLYSLPESAVNLIDQHDESHRLIPQ